MNKIFKLVLPFLLIKSCPLISQPMPMYYGQQEQRHIFVNNRILAKVNGEPISVIDVMKRMDMVFYRQFPQYASSTEARYQFYSINWKAILSELIEKELILSDAKENKVEISQGDLRQEIEKLFGPNIIATLDKAGLTYEEANEMIKEDLIIRRMMFIRVNSKAIRSVTPQKIRQAYVEYAKDNEKPETHCYQVISIRGEDNTNCAEVANHAYELLTKEGIGLEQLTDTLGEHPLLGKTTKVNISEEFQHEANAISEGYKEILLSMTPNTYTSPVAQQSRSNHSMVYRIFYLRETIPGGVIPFHEVEAKLKDSLIDNAVDEETKAYMKKIRKHFDVQDNTTAARTPEDYQPFTIR